MNMIRRLLLLTYGFLSYVLFLATFLYAVGFIGGFLTPTRLDGPRQGSVAAALAINGGLLVLFAVQHSGMARPGVQAVADPVRSRGGRTEHLRTAVERGSARAVLAVAAARRGRLGGAGEPRERPCSRYSRPAG